jgi:hypothetical protein
METTKAELAAKAELARREVEAEAQAAIEARERATVNDRNRIIKAKESTPWTEPGYKANIPARLYNIKPANRGLLPNNRGHLEIFRKL